MVHHYRFGAFRLDPANERLWHGLEEISLRPKSLAVLGYLVTRAGQLVTRDELLQVIWPGITVSDAVLTVCVGEIRQALRDSHHAPQYIETLHRRGYRFRGMVTTAPEPAMAPQFAPPSEVSRSEQSVSSPFPCSTRHSALTTASLVGRKAPLAQLDAWLNQARSGRRQVVFVMGEAGIGKTTLVNAFLARARSEARLWVARGQCMAHYGEGEPYLPVLEALGRLCREGGRVPLLTVLGEYAPTWLAQMPTLLATAELEALQRRVHGVSRQRMLRELAEAVEVLTVESPLILVLEDLHWSDFATLDLIAWLAQRQEPARLLVLGTYRPVDVIVRGHPLQAVKQELMRHRQCTELSLELLSAMEVAQHLASRFGVDMPLTAPFQRLAQTLYRHTDGHPLFMVTMVDALMEQRSLVERGGRWEVQRGLEQVALEVPESLQQLVEHQLSQLSPEDQRILEAGGVAGMQFSAAAVAAGLEEGSEAVEERCATLARRGQFLQPSGVEEWPDGTLIGGYRFRHTLYRQVVYDRLPVGRRTRLHARIGERMEAGYRERAVERAAELATHFEQGREYRKALAYLRMTAEKAVQRSAYQEAIGLLGHALTLLPRLSEMSERTAAELDLQIALGQVLTVSQRPGAAEVASAYARAEVLSQQRTTIPQRIAVVRGLRRVMEGRGEPTKAQPLAEEFLRLAQEAGDAALLIEGDVALGVCSFYRGHMSTAHSHLQAGLAIYDAERPHTYVFPAGQDLGILALAYDAMALWVLGYPQQALEQSCRALHLAEDVAQPWARATALGYAAVMCAWRKERQTAFERAEATIQLATEYDVSPWIGRGMMLRGWALAEQGQQEEGLGQIQQGLATWQANGQELGKSFWLALLGEGYARAAQVEPGLRVIAQGLAMAQTRDVRVWEAELHRLQGELWLQRAPGETWEAETCFRQAIDVARRQQATSLELRATMSLCRLWQQHGMQDAAHQLLTACYHRFSEGFDSADLQEARGLLSHLEA